MSNRSGNYCRSGCINGLAWFSWESRNIRKVSVETRNIGASTASYWKTFVPRGHQSLEIRTSRWLDHGRESSPKPSRTLDWVKTKIRELIPAKEGTEVKKILDSRHDFEAMKADGIDAVPGTSKFFLLQSEVYPLNFKDGGSNTMEIV